MNSDVGDVVGAFRQLLLQGRSLNLPGCTENFIKGDTYDIFNGMTDELSLPVYNPRLPLKVEFMGETGQDLGGHHGQFLRLALKEIFERVTSGPTTARDLDLGQASSYLDRKVCYVAGIVIGEF